MKEIIVQVEFSKTLVGASLAALCALDFGDPSVAASFMLEGVESPGACGGGAWPGLLADQ